MATTEEPFLGSFWWGRTGQSWSWVWIWGQGTLSLRRSVSELSLQGRRRRQQEHRQQALSMAPGAADTQIVPADPGDFDQLTQCLIQAPSNRPYFLLLQGYQDAQHLQEVPPHDNLQEEAQHLLGQLCLRLTGTRPHTFVVVVVYHEDICGCWPSARRVW
ncbi:Hypothetical predicted protein [Marmota monax]|uniref:Uncharacterized protein n=1 Tax=Marmota monax TaxID=9995 RepID=A0A5E4BBF2_MARMO|nr:hypothetical protein GHT09_008376 [Marmota monax]VTJ66696.1 Hypothetical predicted protein [Marmota monax]